jgi:ATP synthase protein I
MSDDARKGEQSKAQSAEEAALSARLRHLGEGLNRAGVSRPGEPTPSVQGGTGRTAMARGLRLSAELVGGVIVGAGLGLGFDYLAGSSPWGFIVFLLFGFAGGVLTVMRSAGVIPPRKM